MSLPKLFDRITWHNNTTPAINEDNLNAMSKAIDDIDDRVIVLGDDVITVVPQIQAYLEQAESLLEAMETFTQNPPYIGANGNWYVWSTAAQSYVDSGVDASITVDIADITMIAEGAQPYVTNTGTDTDPVFHLFLPRSPKGDTGNGISSITKTSTVGLVDTYTITMTDGTTTTFTVTNGRDGSGTGDMAKADYDSDSAVKNAGGIKAWVQSLHYITGLAWSALTGKPFETIGGGLSVGSLSKSLNAKIQDVSLSHEGTASGSTRRFDAIAVEGYDSVGEITSTTTYELPGTSYMETSTKTTSSGVDTFTFTNAAITANGVYDFYCDVYGVAPIDVVVSSGTMDVKFNSSDSVTTCRVYIK